MKGGKNGPENIITSYYQIIEVSKSVVNIRQHPGGIKMTGSKNDCTIRK